MSLALQRTLTPAVARPEGTTDDRTQARIGIVVVFTNVESTLTALRKAGELAGSLGSGITLLAPQVVPYPLPLESPPGGESLRRVASVVGTIMPR